MLEKIYGINLENKNTQNSSSKASPCAWISHHCPWHKKKKGRTEGGKKESRTPVVKGETELVSNERKFEDSPGSKRWEGMKGEGWEGKVKTWAIWGGKAKSETPCHGANKGLSKTKFLICFYAEFGQAVCTVGSLMVTPKCQRSS